MTPVCLTDLGVLPVSTCSLRDRKLFSGSTLNHQAWESPVVSSVRVVCDGESRHRGVEVDIMGWVSSSNLQVYSTLVVSVPVSLPAVKTLSVVVTTSGRFSGGEFGQTRRTLRF